MYRKLANQIDKIYFYILEFFVSSDTKQPIASWEQKNVYRKSENLDWLWKWEARDNN